jgi:hypothetical protein
VPSDHERDEAVQRGCTCSGDPRYYDPSCPIHGDPPPLQTHQELEHCRAALSAAESDARQWKAEAERLREAGDELRRTLAYEARVVEAQTLDVKALGKGRRAILEQEVERMRAVALGDEHPKRWSSGFRKELDLIARHQPAPAVLSPQPEEGKP